ncbi:hypothetical protein ABRT01_02240 [Lentibacillus sp. L22]|uniref:hypothetical protein n=1 Tax=Lentibacillus TaxID=175304 RepID=UPI0022B08C2E|nr:hypothetical protein [Lentibacillus daqui]
MRYLSDEEIEVASRFLFLSMALIVMEQDMQTIESGSFKIKEPYMELLDRMTTEAMNERRKLRDVMRKKHMKVVTLNKNDSFSSYLFLCEGREEKRNYFNPAIRKKVEAIIHELMHRALPLFQPSASANT